MAEQLAEVLSRTILIESINESARRLRLVFVHSSDEEEREDSEFTINYESGMQMQPTFAVTHEVYTVKPHENVTIHACVNGQKCNSIEWYKDNVKVEANEWVLYNIKFIPFNMTYKTIRTRVQE